jgi:hypothetical protein
MRPCASLLRLARKRKPLAQLSFRVFETSLRACKKLKEEKIPNDLSESPTLR